MHREDVDALYASVTLLRSSNDRMIAEAAERGHLGLEPDPTRDALHIDDVLAARGRLEGPGFVVR